MDRRHFLSTAGTLVAAAAVPIRASTQKTTTPATSGGQTPGKARFRTGLVAYSYRTALQSKAMTYQDLIRIAVDTGTDGIDMTVYWLPGTTDDVLLPLRREAYRNRVEIYSIGTRVRLAQPTADLREKELVELRKWVDVAQKMGSTHVRVFGGTKPADATMDQAIGMAVETLKRGAEYAGSRGVILGVEDDGGITEFAKETIQIVTSPSIVMRGFLGSFGAGARLVMSISLRLGDTSRVVDVSLTYDHNLGDVSTIPG